MIAFSKTQKGPPARGQQGDPILWRHWNGLIGHDMKCPARPLARLSDSDAAFRPSSSSGASTRASHIKTRRSKIAGKPKHIPGNKVRQAIASRKVEPVKQSGVEKIIRQGAMPPNWPPLN